MSRPYDLADFEKVAHYCTVHADEFGGRFAEGDLIFGVAFTGHLDDHEAALQRLLSHPELLLVRPAERTWRDVEPANRRLQQLLMASDRHPAVRGVGIVRSEGQFRIMVSLDASQRDAADEIVAIAQPEPIQIGYVTTSARRPHTHGIGQHSSDDSEASSQ